MGDAVWFYHHQGRQLGPVSWADLQARAAQGELEPDDLVWQPELAEWEPARAQSGLFDREPSEPGIEKKPSAVWDRRPSARLPSAVMVHLRPAESLLRAYGRALSERTLDRIDDGAVVVGQVAYLVAAVAAAILMLVVGIQHGDIVPVLLAIVGVPPAFMLALSAASVLAVLRSRIDGSPSVVGRTSIADGMAALAAGFGVLMAVAGVALAVTGAGAVSAVGSIGASVLLLYGAGVALQPSAVNVSVEKGGPGEESLAELRFLAKIIFLRLSPLVFMMTAIAAAVLVLMFFFTSIGEMGAVPGWFAVLLWVRALSVALVPIATWLLFAAVWTTLEVARSLIVKGTESQ